MQNSEYETFYIIYVCIKFKRLKCSLCRLEANLLLCDIVGSEFKHHLRNYVHFRTSKRIDLALNNPRSFICH